MNRTRVLSLCTVLLAASAASIVGCGDSSSDDTQGSADAVATDYGDGKSLLQCRADVGPRPCLGLGPLVMPDVDLKPMFLVKEEVDVDVHVVGEFSNDWNTVSLVVNDKSDRLGMDPYVPDHHFTIAGFDKVTTLLKTDIDGRTYTFSGPAKAVVTNVTVDVTPSNNTFEKWRVDTTTLADDLQKLIDLRQLAKKFETLATSSDAELAQLEMSTLETAKTLLVTMGSTLTVDMLLYPNDDPNPAKQGGFRAYEDMPQPAWDDVFANPQADQLFTIINFYSNAHAVRKGVGVVSPDDAKKTVAAVQSLITTQVARGTIMMRRLDYWKAALKGDLLAVRNRLDALQTTARLSS